MSSLEILEALQTGVMRAQGSQLTAEEREAVAHFLARRHRVVPKITSGFCPAGPGPVLSGDPSWNGWGNSPTNARFQSAREASLDRDQVK